jgi:hypothetical protein
MAAYQNQAWPAHPTQSEMIATRLIKPGECIVSETALLVVSGQRGRQELIFWTREFGAVGVGTATAGYVATITPEVDRPNAADTTAFDNLMIHPNDGHLTAPQQMVSRLKINAFNDYERGSAIVHGRWHFTVFNAISRINHSCRPNAAVDLTWRTRVDFTIGSRVQKPVGAIRALTSIPTGEEISIDDRGHVPGYFVAAVPRRAELLTEYGFQCACPSCTNAAASDARRQIIRQALNTASLLRADFNNNRRVTPPNCNQALRDRVYTYLRAVEEEGIRDSRLGTA